MGRRVDTSADRIVADYEWNDGPNERCRGNLLGRPLDILAQPETADGMPRREPFVDARERRE